MKLGIAQRLTLLLAVIGVLASGFTGYYAYSASRDQLVKAAEDRLLTATRVLGRQVTVALDTVTRDVQLVAGHPRVAMALASRDAKTRAAAEHDLAELFALMLRTRPEYFQIRLIAADDHGMERVRVDRDVSGPVRVEGDELQEKGHYAYVFDTLRLPPGTVYFSRAFINHERGAHAGEDKPTVQLAAAVHGTGADRPLGLLVINVDMNGTFHQLAADLPRNIGLYLAKSEGDFLVHPDSAQAFAFDRGQRILVQEQFPATAALTEGRGDHVLTTAALDPRHGGAVVAAFVSQPLKAPRKNAYFILGLTLPLDTVLKDSDELGFATLRIVLAFSALSVLLAALLARTLTGPISQMVHAVRRFAADGVREPLPLARGDEIGVLAHSFDDMQRQIRAQMATLHDKQDKLDHLASHDALTGLPNRRMFLDRFEHALARARRSGEHMVLLFVDLDNFKEINDRLGHAAGDVILRAAAERMHAVVREIDTVARLGGDEFIVLLDGAHDAAAIGHVAQKVLDALLSPISYLGEALQIGASIGIAEYPQDGRSATDIIAAADRAMYRAKHGGRNRYCFAGGNPAP